MSNLKQLQLNFSYWQADHGGKYPWQISTNENGTLEFGSGGSVSPHIRVLPIKVRPLTLLVCPSDKILQPADDYAHLDDRHISYFVHLLSVTNASPNLILAGDRNLQANGQAVKPGLFRFDNPQDMGWTKELHRSGGCLVFADGHAQFVPTDRLDEIFQRQSLASGQIVVP